MSLRRPWTFRNKFQNRKKELAKKNDRKGIEECENELQPLFEEKKHLEAGLKKLGKHV
jgi:hypothetical protein